MDHKQKMTMKKPSFHHFYEAANTLLASPDIIPTARFIAALTKPPENNQQQEEDDKHRINFFRFCATTFPVCLSLKLMRVYASREPDEIRESAIRFLDETSLPLNLTVVKELSPALISCLEAQVTSGSCFKILTQIVDRVATEIFTVHEATWRALRDYVSSSAETEFAKSVFVFRSLSMPLDGEEFVVPVMENLVPAIFKRLCGEGEERECGLAFVGGFCAADHLLETTRVDLVEVIVCEMLGSMNRGMELGLLGETLKEVEMVVVKQLGWYCSPEFRFVSGLIRRIDEIATKEKCTENALQRIEMVVEKKTFKTAERD